MKLFILILTLLSLLAFTACNSSDDTSTQGLTNEFKEVDIALREHGYGNFETTVIDSNTALDRFLTDIKAQENWNDKASFLAIIENEAIDFQTQNLLFYRITESSGSITLTAQKPIKEANNLLVTIVRDVPDVGTDDMSYNCLAYVLDKNISAMIFNLGDKKETIQNTSKEKPTVCTMQYAPVCASKEVQCVTTPCNPVAQTYSNLCMMNVDEANYLFDGQCPDDVSIPETCTSWYDGCNNCFKTQEGITACTEMYCQLPNGAFECLSFE